MKASPIEERFWKRVIKSADPDKCWDWSAFKTKKGYPMIARNGTGAGMVFAHRLSWVMANGEIERGMCVLHKCDNPSCTNPNHLFLGTRADNNRDKIAKQRHRFGERSERAKLTAESVREIVSRANAGEMRTSIANAFGITRGYVANLVSGRVWKHLGLAKPLPAESPSSGAQGGNGNSFSKA